MSRLKVEGYTHLVREVGSNAIVNTNTSEFEVYMKRIKMRKKNNTNVLLIHGDQDDIVSPTHLLEAKDFLLREKVNVETHLIKNCAHHIPIEASSISLNYILKNF